MGDIVEIVMGQSPAGSTCNSFGEGAPLLNGPTEFGNFHPNPVQWTISPKKECRPGDILFCVRGSTAGRMNWADESYAIGRGLAAIRHKTNFELNYYIWAILKWKLNRILASATGSTFPNVAQEMLKKLSVTIPPISLQCSISSILSCLDDKIEVNNKN